MNKLEKGKAMKCFGRLVEQVECDPDPRTQDNLTEEYNCKNCDSHRFCSQLADILK